MADNLRQSSSNNVSLFVKYCIKDVCIKTNAIDKHDTLKVTFN